MREGKSKNKQMNFLQIKFLIEMKLKIFKLKGPLTPLTGHNLILVCDPLVTLTHTPGHLDRTRKEIITWLLIEKETLDEVGAFVNRGCEL